MSRNDCRLIATIIASLRPRLAPRVHYDVASAFVHALLGQGNALDYHKFMAACAVPDDAEIHYNAWSEGTAS